MTRRRAALLVVAIGLLGLAATAALTVRGGSSGGEQAVTGPTAKDSDPTYGGPTPTFDEGETRDVEGNVTGGRIPEFTHRSARLEDLVVPVVVRPARLRIPALEVDAPVVGVGIDEATFELDVPTDESLVNWYEHGPSPGGQGSAVLGGHVDFDGRAGVFYRLRWLELGERFEVGYEDGSSRTFEVVGRKQFDKERLPTAELFNEDGQPTVTLITCGGEFDEGRRSYSDNLVVYAAPVGSS